MVIESKAGLLMSVCAQMDFAKLNAAWQIARSNSSIRLGNEDRKMITLLCFSFVLMRISVVAKLENEKFKI